MEFPDDIYNFKTYDFNSLAMKYKGFVNPAYKIKVGSSDLNADLGLYSDSIEIKLTIKHESGMCKFTVQNGYDVKAHKFKDIIKNSFPLGKQIEAYIGYGQPKLLFKGFVSDVSFSFGGGAPKVTIACLDIRALMMQGKLNAMPLLASFPLVMMSILIRYISVINMRVVYFDLWNILEEFRQNESDFDYIYNYGTKRGYEFFVLGENIYFLKKWLNLSPVITLEWGESLISFNRGFSYNATDLRGALAGLLSLLPFDFEQPINLSYPKYLLSTQIKTQFDTSDAKNPADLTNMLINYGIETFTKTGGGSVTCIGLPEIVPARFIKLKNLDKNFLDGDYYIDSVTHSFSGSGYTTSFNITSKL